MREDFMLTTQTLSQASFIRILETTEYDRIGAAQRPRLTSVTFMEGIGVAIEQGSFDPVGCRVAN